jgi:RNA recognition motif-containing protein
MNMYVSNLGFHISDENLKSLFTPFGEVSSAKVITDRVTGRSRGFGFVDMPQEAEAGVALLKLEGHEVEGRRISVSKAKPKSSDDLSSKNSNSPWK